MKILVIGKFGQLASCLQEESVQYIHNQFFFLDRNEFPLDDVKRIPQQLDKIFPDIIINTAAYTQVDKAETEQETADLINHQSVAEIAKWCGQNHKKLVQISTDYVFDGTSRKPITESEQTHAINVYGKTKLLAEQAVIESGADFMIVRTSWLYSAFGHNFVQTMCRLMTEKSEINVVNDQYGSPTNAHDLGKHLLYILLTEKWRSGVFHYTNSGMATWFDFAMEIKRLMNADTAVNPVDSSAFPTTAIRPEYSVLCNRKIQETFGIEIEDWRNSLHRFFQNKVKK